MKRIIYILILVISLTLTIGVKAIASPTYIDKWVDGQAYCRDELIYSEWAYDTTTNKYVLLDENGRKIKESDRIDDTSIVKKGKINISAAVPEGIKDIKIRIDISSNLYFYSIELNKENGFSVEKEVNEDVYNVLSYTVTGYNGSLPNQLPNQFKVYENETTSYKIDYSKYDNQAERTNKIKTTIIVVFISLFVIVFLAIILMFLKARSL